MCTSTGGVQGVSTPLAEGVSVLAVEDIVEPGAQRGKVQDTVGFSDGFESRVSFEIAEFV
jgi:hypothetical protein